MLTRLGRGRIVLSLVVLFNGILLLYLSEPQWSTPDAAISFYSVLAFLCVTMTASAATKIRTDPAPTNRWFIAGTSYASIVFCGAAIFYSFSNENPVAHTSPSGIFLNLLAFAITGIIMFIFSYIESHDVKKTSFLYHRLIFPFIVTIGSMLFLVMLVATRVFTDQFVFLIAGYITGAVAVATYIGAGYHIYQLRNSDSIHDSFRLGIAFWLLAGASLNHILILPNPSSLWIISMSLMGISFLYANVATSYTFLVNVGVRENLAYAVTVFLSAIVIVPFVVSRILASVFLTSIFVEIGAKVIIHLAAAILAGASAYAFHERIKYRPSPGQMWIIILLLYWTVAEIALMVSPILPGYSVGVETKVPYVCGAFVSAIVIPMSVRRTLNPQKAKPRKLTPVFIGAIIFSIGIIATGEVIRLLILGVFEVSVEAAISTAIMLSLSYVSLFALLTYVLLLSSASGGRLSFNSLGAGLVSIWLVITILKANYDTWTIGWWSAEVTMVLAIIVFTLILVRLFIIESNRAVKREKRAIAFSRFLSEQIALHQTAAIDSLSSISMDSTTGDSVLSSVSNAMSDISRANELSDYMELFIAGGEFEEGKIGPVSLRDSLYSALECVGLTSTKDSVQVGGGIQSIELRMEQDCSVRANSFLVDAFQYVLQGIINRIGRFKDVSINIRESEVPDNYCVCEMNIEVYVEEPDNILGLFERYIERGSLDAIELAYSKSIIRLLGGSMSLRATKTGGKIVSIVVSIQLKKSG
ncbi:hypothetical protein EU528_06335 [Candidatus Thorarchaeota archaeon]|nr:MAG: hypothetical protein EU528_06335 [Candidatus Thorarchaeota archaeon]